MSDNGKSGATVGKTARMVGAGVRARALGKDADHDINSLERAQEGVKMCEKAIYSLNYDIADDVKEECPNPSGGLWKYGFRYQYSCWILTEDTINHPYIQGLLQHWSQYPRTYKVAHGRILKTGVECDLIPIGEEAKAIYLKRAKDRLVEEVQRIGASLLQRVGDAHKRYDAAKKALDARKEQGKLPATAFNYQEEEYKRELNVKAALSQSEKALTNAVECMRLFEEEENLSALVEGVRETLKAEKANYEAMKAAQIKG